MSTLTPTSSPRQDLKKNLPSPSKLFSQADLEIIDVWEENFEIELYKVMDLIEKYNIVALDTEFPGVIKSSSYSKEDKDSEYQLIKANINSMNVIQIGLSLANEKGEVPTPCTWQFNFKFDFNSSTSSPEAINLLKNSGINFDILREKGINYSRFSELFISSGIVLNENIKWISFHGGFDFGYVLKLLLNCSLPETFDEFNQYLFIYFPNIYDIKYQIQDFDSFRYDGLSKLAYDMKIDRIGIQHQAGSDSLLTLSCFFKLKENYFKNESAIMYRTRNVLFGLGKGFCENYQHNNKTNKDSQENNEYNCNQNYFNEINFNYGKESFYYLLNSIENFNYNFKSYLNPLMGNNFNGFSSNYFNENHSSFHHRFPSQKTIKKY